MYQCDEKARRNSPVRRLSCQRDPAVLQSMPASLGQIDRIPHKIEPRNPKAASKAGIAPLTPGPTCSRKADLIAYQAGIAGWAQAAVTASADIVASIAKLLAVLEAPPSHS